MDQGSGNLMFFDKLKPLYQLPASESLSKGKKKWVVLEKVGGFTQSLGQSAISFCSFFN